MDAKLPMDTFENVMGLAIEGCKAIASYIREVNNILLIFSIYLFSVYIDLRPVIDTLGGLLTIVLKQVLLENTKKLECQRG
jgi:hypothetical protein